MEAKKPFKETKIGKLITEKLPDVAATIGDLLPNEGVLGIAKNAIDMATVSKEEKAELNKALADLEFMYFQERNKDVANARQREVDLKNTIGVYMQNSSAGLIILAFVGLLYGIVFMKMEVQNKELVYTLLGSLGTIVVTIFNYWFGSSSGSSKSNDALRDLVKK